MKTILVGLLSLGVVGVSMADEPSAPSTEQPPDSLPRVRVTLRSSGEPLDIGVERDDGSMRGAHFEMVCQTPCAVSVPTNATTIARLQVRAPGSPGAALNLDPVALDGAKLTLEPPKRKGIRAGAALLAVGIITTAVGGVLIPYGREVASRSDVNPDAGMPGGAVTFGAGVASTIAGALLLATSRPKVHKIDRTANESNTASAEIPFLGGRL